ncbi:MAG: glycosyltransferase family A protein, partial [Gammaproteobacteria bacterium]
MYFSIIIPCYNAEKTLGRALDSIIAQQDYVKEIILIDDGSQDQTQAIAKHYIHQHPSCTIHYHHQNNQGPAKARNKGAELTTGEYTLFLDHDDTLCNGALALFQQTFLANPNTKLLIAGAYDINGNRKKLSLPKLYPNNLEILKAYWFQQLSIEGGATPIRTQVLKTTHYPESINHGEDIVFFSHLLSQYPAKILPIATLNSYRHPNSLRNQQKSILADGDKLTSILFNPNYLKPEYMKFKPKFH